MYFQFLNNENIFLPHHRILYCKLFVLFSSFACKNQYNYLHFLLTKNETSVQDFIIFRFWCFTWHGPKSFASNETFWMSPSISLSGALVLMQVFPFSRRSLWFSEITSYNKAVKQWKSWRGKRSHSANGYCLVRAIEPVIADIYS